jgi:DNA excision repair protein ERCC-4
MVDLLMTRVPLDDIAGILVYRAHEWVILSLIFKFYYRALTSYQEPFILRLFREKKQNGFVKAFTDYPSGITRMGLGQLQRLIDRLYVKRVEILPRFDEAVKATFEASQVLNIFRHILYINFSQNLSRFPLICQSCNGVFELV